MYRRRNEGWSKKVDIVTLATMENRIGQIRKLAESKSDYDLIIREVEGIELAIAHAQGKFTDFDLTKHRMPEQLKTDSNILQVKE